MSLEAADYKSAAETIESMGGIIPVQQARVDPKEALSTQVNIGGYDYSDACSIIADLEALKLAEDKELSRQQRGAQPGMEAVGEGAQQIKQGGAAIAGALSGVGKGMVGTAGGIGSEIGKIVSSLELKKKVAAIDKDTIKAAGEIRGITGSAAKEFEGKVKTAEVAMKKAAERKPQAKKLILPGLSLQDQIHDLEGISDGLAQNAFDGEQLGVIRDEVEGVEEARKIEKESPADAQLLALRNKLLEEVKNRLLSASS
ncbi:MAG: hypothetical protein KGH59_03185 [Candidatus Micrarchaeota archaeon]|nr:hypothetical protein [Candidatus Micrarchaeota archaeon]MDE1804760.1 hypothetical protein [Candidatus Micrarchaeota archaeon]